MTGSDAVSRQMLQSKRPRSPALLDEDATSLAGCMLDPGALQKERARARSALSLGWVALLSPTDGLGDQLQEGPDGEADDNSLALVLPTR